MTTFEKVRQIDKEKEDMPEGVVDILIYKSSIAGVTDESEKVKFSDFIREAYDDIQDSFNGHTKIILKIVASVPDVNIIFLPNEGNIREYGETEKQKFKTGGITYAKHETIVIAAKGYDEEEYYRKFLGVVIHEFCHFAVHETFGNAFKPYFVNDKNAAKKWSELVNQYKSSDLTEFPVIKEVYRNYLSEKRVDELVVRFPQIYVQYHDNIKHMDKFEQHFIDFHKLYIHVHNTFNSENVKTASLRTVNEKNNLEDKLPQFFSHSFENKLEIDMTHKKQIIVTKQIFLVMKNIYDAFNQKMNFKSTFMFIKAEFLKNGADVLSLIETALQCKKGTYLVIACYSKNVNQNLEPLLHQLLEKNCNGKIIFIVSNDNYAELYTNIHHSLKDFTFSEIIEYSKVFVKVKFQGSSLLLSKLIDLPTLKSLESYIEGKSFEVLMEEEISIGNHQTLELDEYYVKRVFLKKGKYHLIEIDLNNHIVLKEIFDFNHLVFVSNESGEGKSTESVKMYQRFKNAYPDHWIVSVDLAAYTDALKSFLTPTNKCKEFFANSILKMKTIESEIFFKFFDNGMVIFIFDSLDKVSRDDLDVVKKIITQIKKNNRICCFTRPFVLSEFEEECFVKINLSEFTDKNIRSLVEKILEDKVKNNNHLSNQICNFLSRIVSSQGITESEANINNELKTPLFVKITTKVFAEQNFGYQPVSVSKYDIYFHYVYGKSLTNHKFKKVYWKIALENNFPTSRHFFNKYHINYDETRDKFKTFIDEFTGKACFQKIDMNPLLHSKIVTKFSDQSYQFVHDSFEEFFIIELLRDRHEDIFKEERYKYIFFLLVTNLALQFRFSSLMSHLRGCEEVEDPSYHLAVFKQYFEANNGINNQLNIAPVLDELSLKEESIERKFLCRISYPKDDNLRNISFSTLLKCGAPSPVNFYISYEKFEILIASWKENCSLKDLHHLFNNSIGDFVIFERFSNSRLVKTILKFSDSYSKYQVIKARLVNDFINLILTDHASFTNLFVGMISSLQTHSETKLKYDVDIMEALKLKNFEYLGTDISSCMNNLIDEVLESIKVTKIEIVLTTLFEKHNELMTFQKDIMKVFPLHMDFVESLVKASSILGECDEKNLEDFPRSIKKIYEDIKDSHNELTEIIMKIVANNPRLKIKYLLSRNIFNNFEENESEIKFEGVTFEKSEVIFILAEDFSDIKNNREILGKIIEKFSVFAIAETFGNRLKPYYAHDKKSERMWSELVKKYALNIKTADFPFVKQIFEKLSDTEWTQKLVLQYPQLFFKHQAHGDLLQKFEETFLELTIIYKNYINLQFNLEIVKIAALDAINVKTLLGNGESKLHTDSLANFKINLGQHRHNRHIIKTNVTFLAMKNIFNNLCKSLSFKSSSMFMDIEFLQSDYHMRLIKLALNCKKRTNLVIDCQSSAYKKSEIRENLKSIFHGDYAGRIILLLDREQNFDFITEVQSINFSASDVTDTFMGSLKVNFQGRKVQLKNLDINIRALKRLDDFFEKKTYKTITTEEISIGNQLNILHIGSLNETYNREDDATCTNLNDDDVLREMFDMNTCIMIECLPETSVESLEMCKRLKHNYSECWIIHLSKSELPLIDLAKNESENFSNFSKKCLNLGIIEKEICLHFFNAKKIILVINMNESFEENKKILQSRVENIEKLVTIMRNKNIKICVFAQTKSIIFFKKVQFFKIKMVETCGVEDMTRQQRSYTTASVQRTKIVEGAVDLPEKFKYMLNFLSDHTCLYGLENVDLKDKFTGWVIQIYKELIENEFARIIMQIVSCAYKVLIIYMPEHSNIYDIENTGNAKYIAGGITYARVEQIIIAAKDYENERNRDELKGLIIHHFCYFAVYETFCNGFDAFYSDDEIHKTQWNAAIQECKENRNMEKIIDEAFDYPERKWLQELVVRYFQYQVQYQNYKQKLSEFKNNFPKLCAICEDYVLENFKHEYEEIRAIREINQCVTMSDDSLYKIDAVRCDVQFDPYYNTQVIKSNNTALMANYIFFEFKKNQNFKGNYVFLNSNYLSEKGNFEKFKRASLRRAKCTFVLDCDHDNFDTIKTELKEEIEKKADFKKNIVLLGKHQNFEIKAGLEYICNFIPSNLTDEFINHIEINFQGQEMFLKELITIEEFLTFTSLPVEKMHRERISIGNQMKQQVITEYVERKFLIKNQSDDQWENIDDSETISAKHKRILVANEPGAGKSIESIKMYYRLKYKYPKDWIIHINLSRLVEVFEEEKEKFQNYSQSEKFKILFCHSILKLNEFEYDLFEFLLKSGRVVLIFDSLDEISPFYFSLVSSLTQMIIQKFSEQRLIIFTRPHLVIEMEEFEFAIVKIDEIEESARNDLISNILNTNCSHKSEEARNDMKKSVQSFLQKRNFHTPLLIRMVTEFPSMQHLNSDEMSLYDIYKEFCDNFDQLQKDKNKNIKAEKITLRNIDKYFQRCAIEKLIGHRISSDVVEPRDNEKIEINKNDLISFKKEFFNSLKIPDIEKLQRKGITIHSKSNPKEFEFIHASFNDFFIADFIISEFKTLVKNHKYSLMEIFSMLIQESRLNNVIEFLKGHDDVAEYLKEFDVIYQLIDSKKIENGLNIMPVINFIADSIARNSIMRKICKENKFYTSMITLTDPIRTLEKLCSFKVPKTFVYENVLMNRCTEDGKSYDSLDYRPRYIGLDDWPINILDILAQCGTEDSFGFYVSKDVFAKYFDKLTVEKLKFGQIASMMEVLKENRYVCDKFNRSFFTMAKTHNKVIIDTFLNFYAKLLEDSYFADPQFSNFISILILNNQSDHERLKILIEKLADLNKKSVRELFSSSKLKLGAAWGDAIRANIENFRDTTSPEQFEKAINFYVDIFDNGPDGSYSGQQAEFWFSFISTLLDVHLFDTFQIAVNRLADRYENASAMLRELLMKKDDSGLIFLRKVCCFNLNEKDPITDFTFKLYKRIFGCDLVEIRGLFLEPEFFIKLFLAKHDNTRITSSILQFLNKAENETNSWLELMISYSNCIGTDLIDSLLMTGALRKLSFKNKHPELSKLMKEILQKCINLPNNSEVIYEIFSNESLTKDQFSYILDAIIFKDNILLECQIIQILSYKHPKDGSTIIIVASKCKQDGRIEILMKMLESYSDTELFKSCILSTDKEGKSALFYLLRNKHQENFFQTLFDKVESYYTFNQKDLIRDLIYSTEDDDDDANRDNIFYETLTNNIDDISEEKYKILEKLFNGLSRDEQKKLIFTVHKNKDSLLEKVIRNSFEVSKRVLNLTLNDLFENENLYHKVLKKFKRFSGYTGKFLVSAEVFSSAYNYYKIKGSDEKVIDRLDDLLDSSSSHNLSIGNFHYFRQDRVIRHLLSEVNNDKYTDVSEKNLMITFIFMLNCDDYIQLLENTIRKIQILNYEQPKKLTLFSLIKSMKLNIEELEVVFKRKELYNDSPFCLYLEENSYSFLHEFLDFIESMCTHKTEFCELLALQLKYYNGNNIFHEILSNYEVASNSNMYYDIYETLKIKLGDSKLLNDLHRQKNNRGETPIMLALRYANIEKCLKFISENLVETSLTDLLQVKDSLNDISHFVFINLLHTDFESIIKILSNYFEVSDINEMFENSCLKKYSCNRNFIHLLFGLKTNDKFVPIRYLTQLFDEMKKRFGIDHLTQLILQEDEDNKTPLDMIHYRKSIMPYFELIEKYFKSETIRTLLNKNEGTYDWILYKELKYNSQEDKLFTVQFYKKYFCKEEFESMLRKVFETSDYEGNKLINIRGGGFLSRILKQLYSYFEIISDNIHDIEFIKTVFSQVNNIGHALLAIDNLHSLIHYVYVVKLAEFYFSRDVVKLIFKIEDSTHLMSMFVYAKDYERYEMIELLKKYRSDDWIRVLSINQFQSMKIYERFSYQKMKIIDLESEEYGYGIHEFLRILVGKLSNFEKSIEQENNYQGYAIVIFEQKLNNRRDFIFTLQADFSIPREKLTSARINGLKIEWKYDEKFDKFTNLNGSYENQEFSLDMINKTCIAIKSDEEHVKVLVPVRNSENIKEHRAEASHNKKDDTSHDMIYNSSEETLDEEMSEVILNESSDDDMASIPPKKRRKKSIL